jgi:hypothetical protein
MPQRCLEMAMASFYSDNRQDTLAEDAYRAWLISRNPPPIVHHSSAILWKRMFVHAHRLVDRVDAVLHWAIEMLAVAKVRRIRRELQLRGITYAPFTDASEPSRK